MDIAKIKAIFFDLDNTLFNHSCAERAALIKLMAEHPLIFASVSRNNFLQAYNKHNTLLWKKFGKGDISSEALKVLRFKLSLKELNCVSENIEELSDRYFEIYSKQGFVFPNVNEILTYLKPKYLLGILSNGFTTTQEAKLKNINLSAYFAHKIYSGNVGALKPNPMIFNEAMRIANVQADEVVYVGDSYEDDIRGAKAVGWNVIHFIPEGKFINDGLADYEIRDLLELKRLL